MSDRTPPQIHRRQGIPASGVPRPRCRTSQVPSLMNELYGSGTPPRMPGRQVLSKENARNSSSNIHANDRLSQRRSRRRSGNENDKRRRRKPSTSMVTPPHKHSSRTRPPDASGPPQHGPTESSPFSCPSLSMRDFAADQDSIKRCSTSMFECLGTGFGIISREDEVAMIESRKKTIHTKQSRDRVDEFIGLKEQVRSCLDKRLWDEAEYLSELIFHWPSFQFCSIWDKIDLLILYGDACARTDKYSRSIEMYEKVVYDFCGRETRMDQIVSSCVDGHPIPLLNLIELKIAHCHIQQNHLSEANRILRGFDVGTLPIHGCFLIAKLLHKDNNHRSTIPYYQRVVDLVQTNDKYHAVQAILAKRMLAQLGIPSNERGFRPFNILDRICDVDFRSSQTLSKEIWKSWQTVLPRAPKHPTMAYECGLSLFRSARYTEANEYFVSAIDSGNYDCLSHFAACLVCEIFEHDRITYNKGGSNSCTILTRKHDSVACRISAHFERVLHVVCREKNPLAFWLIMHLGRVSGLGFETNGGCPSMKELVRLHPQSWIIQFVAGLVLQFEGKFKEASKIFRTIHSMDMRNLCVNSKLIECLLWENKIVDAVRVARHVLMADREDPMALIWVGHAFSQTKRVNEAIENYERALSMDPTLLGGVIGLSLIYEKRNAYLEIISLIEKHLVPCNHAVKLHYLLSKSYVCVNRMEDAQSQIDHVLMENEYFPNAAEMKAKIEEAIVADFNARF